MIAIMFINYNVNLFSPTVGYKPSSFYLLHCPFYPCAHSPQLRITVLWKHNITGTVLKITWNLAAGRNTIIEIYITNYFSNYLP